MGTQIVGVSTGTGQTSCHIIKLHNGDVKHVSKSIPSLAGLGIAPSFKDLVTGLIEKPHVVNIKDGNIIKSYSIGRKDYSDVVHGVGRLSNGINAALTTGVLKAAETPVKTSLILAIAIPTEYFYTKTHEEGEKVENTALTAKIKTSYMEMMIDYKVEKVVVYPEATPPLFSWFFTVNGALITNRYEAGSTILSGDIGANTLELARTTLVSGQPIRTDHDFETSVSNAGVRGTDEFLRQFVCDAFREKGIAIQDLGPYQLDAVYQDGQLTIKGKVVDCRPLILKAFDSQANRIHNAMLTHVEPNEYNDITLSGGGAVVFRKPLQEWLPNATIRDHKATADGLVIAALLEAKRLVMGSGYTGAAKSVQGTLEALREMYG